MAFIGKLAVKLGVTVSWTNYESQKTLDDNIMKQLEEWYKLILNGSKKSWRIDQVLKKKQHSQKQLTLSFFYNSPFGVVVVATCPSYQGHQDHGEKPGWFCSFVVFVKGTEWICQTISALWQKKSSGTFGIPKILDENDGKHGENPYQPGALWEMGYPNFLYKPTEVQGISTI